MSTASLNQPQTPIEYDREEMSEIVNRLVKVYDPLRIYLFGSYAWGTPTKDSDYDLCVVVGESDETRWNRGNKGYRAISGGWRNKPVDIIVYTLNDFEHSKDHPSAMASLINRKGKLLYSLPESLADKLRSILPKKDKLMVIQLHEAWLFKVANDLAVADDLFQMAHHSLDAIIYHTQQCAEKVLKGFLAFHRQEIQKTHDLGELIDACVKIDISFIELTDKAEFLSPNATKFRYADQVENIDNLTDLLPSREDVQTAIEFATHVLEFVKCKIENKTTEHTEIEIPS